MWGRLALIGAVSVVPWLFALRYFMQPVRGVGGQPVLVALMLSAALHAIGAVLAVFLWSYADYWTGERAERGARRLGWVSFLAGCAWALPLWLFLTARWIHWWPWFLGPSLVTIALIGVATLSPPSSRCAGLRVAGALAVVTLGGSVAVSAAWPFVPFLVVPALWASLAALLRSALAQQVGG